jgi:hypothetical protein
LNLRTLRPAEQKFGRHRVQCTTLQRLLWRSSILSERPEQRRRWLRKPKEWSPILSMFDPSELVAVDQQTHSTENRWRPLTELTPVIEVRRRLSILPRHTRGVSCPQERHCGGRSGRYLPASSRRCEDQRCEDQRCEDQQAKGQDGRRRTHHASS